MNLACHVCRWNEIIWSKNFKKLKYTQILCTINSFSNPLKSLKVNCDLEVLIKKIRIFYLNFLPQMVDTKIIWFFFNCSIEMIHNLEKNILIFYKNQPIKQIIIFKASLTAIDIKKIFQMWLTSLVRANE